MVSLGGLTDGMYRPHSWEAEGSPISIEQFRKCGRSRKNGSSLTLGRVGLGRGQGLLCTSHGVTAGPPCTSHGVTVGPFVLATKCQ